ncbi:bifunctional DNA-formamidopyrimidine glycosylase/DNA-(apurinic or apyrimidinic site) lyase [Paludibacterium paludis]|uniref:Formamidopyrimidine-DNA glycosylase n=1 Tax=Paludibacterium paludis TaxID=1225769 RepID=A0A918P0L1_9NEIS|nr:bifunctional DNA-formamidopyrimidine glycosylase/DNA-(apurinic or apyrimidinic site) lyase [Paludibacterium paludis]GGY08512.1 formamidopyrimidine-DNA glycosylase [Paludibacterium paludis]
MPELPEVETTRKGIEPYLQGATVRDADVREPRLRWPVTPGLDALLKNLQVRSVARRAKYLLIGFDPGTLLIHLGMSGSLRVVDHDMPVEKHDHVDIVLDERRIRYRDPRRFGAILWYPGAIETHPLLAGLGPEPLGPAFGGAVLFNASRGKSLAVKPFLMDNHVVVGVGNIYANEALFQAGIRPGRAAGRLTRADCDRLALAIRDVLARAIDAGGSTLKDFVDASGKPGYFQQSYFVYGRAEAPCLRCGSPIRHIRQGQRSSYYCPHCQPC